jgi:hypothetical protein
MITKALTLILSELRSYIGASGVGADPDAPEYVVLGNIAQADAPDLTPPIRERVVLSLVNVHEEATLKNQPFREAVNGRVRYRNAPAFLNLFLLFSANYDDYENALVRLTQVIEFFQGRNVFTYNDAPVAELMGEEGVQELRLVLSLYSMTFEQVNHLWGSLGGKQYPFVLYKLRLVKVFSDRTELTAPLIEEVEGRETLD